MGWFRTSEVKPFPKALVAKLQEDNDSLLNKLEEKTIELDEIAINKDKACSIVLDFDNIDVFSIERNNGRTVVGYWVVYGPLNRQTKEWYYDCNTDVHEQLIKDHRYHMRQEREYDDE